MVTYKTVERQHLSPGIPEFGQVCVVGAKQILVLLNACLHEGIEFLVGEISDLKIRILGYEELQPLRA